MAIRTTLSVAERVYATIYTILGVMSRAVFIAAAVAADKRHAKVITSGKIVAVVAI